MREEVRIHFNKHDEITRVTSTESLPVEVRGYHRISPQMSELRRFLTEEGWREDEDESIFQAAIVFYRELSQS